jgi:membrane associated rhomboid family serine protease
MIPIKDYNPTSRAPIVTILLIAVNVVVYFFVQPHYRPGDEAKFTFEHAAIPCEVVNGRPLADDEIRRTLPPSNDTRACEGSSPASPPDFPQKSVYLAILYSMFLHGSLLHIGGNMLFLWIFGNNIEDVMGPLSYLGFYLLAGLVAAAAHIAVQPSSTIPVVGASGAIAGVMGAYAVLFPDVRIRTVLIIFLFFIRDIRAKYLLGFWFVLQFFTNPAEGVAWVAHVGGFIFGAIVALLLRDRLRPKRAAWPPELVPPPTV